MAKANSKKRARHVYMICLSFWVLVLIAAAVYAWRHFSGLVDGFTLIAMIKQFGGGDFMT